MKNQTYLFQVTTDEPTAAVEVNWPGRKRDEAHEARLAMCIEVETYVLFDKLNRCSDPRLTPEERGRVAQAIRAQSARKRPRAERTAPPAEKFLAAQIEYLLAIYECNKDEDMVKRWGRPLGCAAEFERLVKRIRETILIIESDKNAKK